MVWASFAASGWQSSKRTASVNIDRHSKTITFIRLTLLGIVFQGTFNPLQIRITSLDTKTMVAEDNIEIRQKKQPEI
jgi:hypothetical protein